MKEKVILDTDIGSDIDDAICLGYLLSQDLCELVGITTVSGESEKRAMIASYLCEKAGKNIPVYCGLSEPFIGDQKQKIAQQYEFLEKISYKKPCDKEWFNFIRSQVRKNPYQINLITIGPLTNIGILFKIDPELSLLLKSMYIMGGMFFGENKKAEWNVSCDPYAAHTVFSSKVSKIYVFGLDVTTKVKMKKEDCLEEFSRNCLLKEVLNFAEIWFRSTNIITFHDPLAAANLFEKNLCNFKKGKVFVNQIGETGFIEDQKGNIFVASEVNSNLFFEHFSKIFLLSSK
ncbi:MAG: nucleoside hydrolase [Candidatus Omnitrophica bacterium]|nr:nucleoside hydrolase [Candidatus Omnitrophota bacterium]